MVSQFFKHALALIVLLGLFSFHPAQAGSYEDFFRAIEIDDVAKVKELLTRGFDVNTRSPDNQHGLYLALREPSPKVAKLMLSEPKIDVNALNTEDESPLMMAALKGQVDTVQALIAKDADINKPGWTPLHYAATTGQVQIIAMLLEKHAYIDAESPNKTTPLMMAAHYGTPGAVKLLLEEGADVSLKNDQDLSAMDFAQKANKQDAVDIIAAFVRAKQPKGKW